MPKRQRLSRAEFNIIANIRGRRFFGAYFSLSAIPYPPDNLANEATCACVVSKKAAKRAVDRNRIKRLVRESLRTLTRDRTMRYSVILYAKKESVGVPYAVVFEDIRSLLDQIR